MKSRLRIRFRKVNRDVFEAIREKTKQIETRAGTNKYKSVAAGDCLILVCGKNKILKKVKRAEHFKTISALLRKYQPIKINPFCKTKKDIEKMYLSFPGYKEKIRKYGLVAWKFK